MSSFLECEALGVDLSKAVVSEDGWYFLKVVIICFICLPIGDNEDFFRGC
jgi:hypothetical protein